MIAMPKSLVSVFAAAAVVIGLTGCNAFTDYKKENIKYYGEGGEQGFDNRLGQAKASIGMSAAAFFRLLEIDRTKFDILSLNEAAWEHRGIRLETQDKPYADATVAELEGVTVLRMKFVDIEDRFGTDVISVRSHVKGYERVVVVALKDDKLLEIRDSRTNFDQLDDDSVLDDAVGKLMPFVVGAVPVGAAAAATGGAALKYYKN